PSPVPSRSIEVRSTSPAPRRTVASLAHVIASSPVGVRPASIQTSQPPPGRRFASIARTTPWAPKRSAQRARSPGSRTAALFRQTLSAPARSSARTSSSLRTPPPTVSGMNTRSAVRATTSSVARRPSIVAAISRNTSSSAPSASYPAASSAGSPASRRSAKRIPFTTRPASTSRHGTMRLARLIARPSRTRSRPTRGLPARRSSSPNHLRETQRARVQRLADDDRLETEVPERVDVLGLADAAARDHRQVGQRKDPFVEGEIRPVHRSVPLHRGHHEPGGSRVGERADGLLHPRSVVAPAVQRETTGPDVHGDGDPVAEPPNRLRHEPRVQDRRRPKDRAGGAVGERPIGRLDRSEATSELHGH